MGSSLLATLLLTAFALLQGVTPGKMPDFFIYRLGAELAVRGENPYSVATVRAHVAQEFPDSDPNPDSPSHRILCF